MTTHFRRLALALPVLLVGFALVACGDDDDGGDIQIGSDDDYVRASCEAQNEFFGEIFSAAFSLDEDASEEEQLEAMREPVENMVDAMRDARPPADAVDYHRALVEGMEDLLAAIEDGDAEALEQLGDIDVDSELSEETRERLSSLSEELEECEGFGNPFGES